MNTVKRMLYDWNQAWEPADGCKRKRQGSWAAEHKAELIFVLVMGCLLFGLSWILPFNEAPDEAMRYLIPQYIYKYGRLPKGWEEEVRSQIWGISYAFQPYLPYIIGGYLMKLTALVNDSEKALLMTARLVNIVIGMGFYWYVVQIAKKMIKSRLFRNFFIALLAMLPQLLYLFTYVNTDGIAMFSSAMIVYYWLEGLETRWNKSSCIGLAVGIGICALSYFNAYGYALCSVVLFITSMILYYGKTGSRACAERILKRGCFIAVIVLLIAGWWFVRAAILFDGDILGMNTSSKYGELYAQEEFKPSVRQSVKEQGISLGEMLKESETGGMDWCRLTYRSTIGVFGYAKYIMGLDLYEIHKRLFLLGFVGTLLRGLTGLAAYLQGRVKKRQQCSLAGESIVLQASLICSMIIPVILAVYYSYASDFQPQGRYLMPMILPLMYYTATGIERFVTLVFRKWMIYPIMFLMFYAVLHVFLGAFVSLYIPTFVESCADWANIRFLWFGNIGILTKVLQALIPG